MMKLILIPTILTAFISAQTLPDFSVTDDELLEVADQMREADDNKATEGQVVIDFGGEINIKDKTDHSPNRFFVKVDPSLLSKHTYAAYIKMFNNYNKAMGIEEPKVDSTEDNIEIKEYLDAIEKTKPYQILLNFLQSKNHPYGKSSDTLKEAISRIWFDRYSRSKGRAIDSSGFEHVFIGETRKGQVLGLHSWLRMFDLESNPEENFDYKGFIEKTGDDLGTIKFSWDKKWKRIGGMLIGTSPEYDISLFTLCFLSRRGRNTCKINVDECPVEIQSYDLVQNGNIFVGTAYPKVAGPCSYAR